MSGLQRKAIFRQYLASVVCYLSIATAGAAYVWPEPLTYKLTEPCADGVPVTPEQMSWLMSVISFGCAVGSIPSSYFAQWWGRKYVTLSVGPINLLSWIVILSATSVEMLYLARVIQGIATAVAFAISPLYTAEIVDPSIRGAIPALVQVTFYAGCLTSFFTGPYVSYKMYALASLILPTMFTITFIYFPESPYWLIKQGKHEKARKALKWFRAEDNVEDILNSMKQRIQEEMSQEGASWKTIFSNKYERKSFIIVQIVATSKFLTGMPTIISYATDTFSRSESALSSSEMTIILGVVLLGFGVISAFPSDRIPCKWLLLLSSFGSFISHFFTMVYFYLHEKTDIDAKPYIWLMFVGIILYCFFSDVGLAPLIQTLRAELFMPNTREMAAGITQSYAWILCFIIVKIYQPITNQYGIYVNFLLYGLVGLVSGIILAIIKFESEDKTTERLEGIFENTHVNPYFGKGEPTSSSIIID